MWGTIVNALSIFLGGLVGLLVGKKLSDNLKDTLEKAVGLGVILVGIQMAIKTQNILIVLLSLVIGGVIGELLNIEKLLHKLASSVEVFLKPSGEGKFV